MQGETSQQFAVRLDRRFGGRYAHGSHAPAMHSRPVALSSAYVSQSDKIIAERLGRAGRRLATP